MTPAPGAGEEGSEGMPGEGSCGELGEERLHLLGSQGPGSMQASEAGEHFAVDVGRGVQFPISQPRGDRPARAGAGQQVHQGRSVDD